MTLLLKQNPSKASVALLGSAIDFFLCRDRNSHPARRRMVILLAEGFTLREGSAVPPALIHENLTSPDLLARALHKTASNSTAFQQVPFQLWHALALAYNSLPGKNQEEDLTNFVLGCLDGVSEDMTIVREEDSTTFEVQSYTTFSRVHSLLASAPSSYKNGALTVHESCIFSIQDNSGVPIAKVKMWVEYDIAPSTKAEGVYRTAVKKVKLVLTERDCRDVRQGEPGSVCSWHNIPKALAKHYVRVPEKPTHVLYSACNLQRHNPRYMARRVFYDVSDIDECILRAYSVISGMPLEVLELSFCNTVISQEASGVFRVVVRGVVGLVGYDKSSVVQQGAVSHGRDAVSKMGVCMSFVASQAHDACATILRHVAVTVNTFGNVLTLGGGISLRDFLAGSAKDTDFAGGHIFNLAEEIVAHGLSLWEDLGKRHRWASHSVPVRGDCGIFIQHSDEIREILRSQPKHAANIVEKTGVNTENLRVLLSSILSNSSGSSLPVELAAHYVAHEGVVADNGDSARRLPVNQHVLEEHLVYRVTSVSGIHIHACVDYVVEDIDTPGSVKDLGLCIRDVRIGTRVASSAEEVCSAIQEKEGRIDRNDFAWFNVDQSLVETSRAEFRAAIGTLPILPSTRSLLSSDLTYFSRDCSKIENAVKERMLPALTLYAKKIAKRNAEGMLRVTGDPLRGSADTRWLAQMLESGKVLVQSPNILSVEEYGTAFVSPNFNPAKCEEDDVREAGGVRARLAATLQNMLGDPRIHVAVSEAIVSMSDVRGTDLVRLCRELICTTILSKKCAVQVVDTGLRIIPEVQQGGTGTLRLYQHVLFAPVAWWIEKPIAIHLVVRSDLVIHRDLTGALAFNIESVRFGLRASQNTVLSTSALLLECKPSLLGLCCTVDVQPSEEEGVYSSRALHVMAAIQRYYGSAYSFLLVDPLEDTRSTNDSLLLLVRTGIGEFLNVFGVDGVVRHPLLCFTDSSQDVGEHLTSEQDIYNWISKNYPGHGDDIGGIISEALFNATGFGNVCKFLRFSVGPNLEITPVERGGYRNPQDVSGVIASGPDGLFTARPYLVKLRKGSETSTLGLVCTCNISVRPGGNNEILVQVRGLKVSLCSGRNLLKFFLSTSPDQGIYHAQYSEFLHSLEPCSDLSEHCLQARVQSAKLANYVRRKQHPGIHTQHEHAPGGPKASDAGSHTMKRHGRVLPTPMDPKVLQDLRSSNLLAAAFGGERFPENDHILRTMKALVDVASRGQIICASPESSHKGALYTNVARMSENRLWVLHNACFMTPDLRVLMVELHYKVDRKKSPHGGRDIFEICDGSFNVASGDTPSKKDFSIRIPKNVQVSENKWNIFSEMLKPPVVPESFLDKMCRWLTTAWNSLKSFVSNAGGYVMRLFRACCSCVRPQNVSEDNVTLLDSNRDSHECESAVSEVSAPAPVIDTSSEHVHSNDVDTAQSSTKAKGTDGKKPSTTVPKKPPRPARGAKSSSAHSVAGVTQGGAGDVTREVGGPSTSVADPTAASSVSQLQSSRASNVSQQQH
ncbi:hypothetical protein [Anaplasma phagocytophilum]|uniref:Uncharacterized protein n=1 Tax=Anaplasma phagocytophilum str. ApWI1 TaxID=1359155 RepID=A0A0F3Q0V3_ANAPH|nr:hypothetical protein [Anaplasma phagocytophilum]KJZ99081.1 hypothetical protein APHCR_0401 [Anaplasma phagocytophilum str. CR1007]EOA61157.1 hypothetical protein HGE1_03857 [Anaplasma phagocytophilum str. HGE1]KJV82470.1 hypothetical protein APHHGE2_1212 [Anaplasma phagocytophilum str. HGE2]KJV85064.1 hypothetical protein APHWI1_0415 [Anaplasma phagocytophilum str. ApWI1]KJV98448.1 hypothetical protein OTSANNIE_1184 [Anaplasma phagocytophilum str. Annie]